MFKSLFFFLFFVSYIHAQVVPDNRSSFDQQFDVTSFYKLDRSQQFFFNAQAIKQQQQSNKREFEFNYRYSLNRYWRIAAIIKRAYGLRHNNDWTKDSGVWSWTNTNSRGETLAGLMIQHKHSAWGRGKGIFKNRLTLHHNYFNGQNTLFYKVGILNFQWKDWTTIHQFEVGIPLNYNRDLINELWHYSAFMYHFRSWLKFGPKLSLGKMTWNESQSFKVIRGNHYTQSLLIYRLGLGVLITL